MKLAIAPEIFEKLTGDVQSYFVIAEGLEYDAKLGEELAAEFKQFQEDLRAKEGAEDLHEDKIKEWQEAFVDLGLEDTGVKVSLANMLERVVKSGKYLASVHPLVDFYNMFVLEEGIPLGAYDLDRLEGDIAVRYADGSEQFQQLGKAKAKPVDEGDLILTDANGVMCQHWVWKQSDVSKIRPYTKNVLFRFEVVGFVDAESAYKKIEQFTQELKKRFKVKSVEILALNADQPSREVELSNSVKVARQKVKFAQELLSRGVAEVNVYENLFERLLGEEQLRIKFGIDPTGSDLTLGHAVPLRKLKQFQDAGHQIVLLFGTFTGRIGDPTGKSATRTQLTKEEVLENVKTYLDQAGKVFDTSAIEVVYNHEWLEEMSFEDVLKLAGNFTVAQMLERDMFQERIKNEQEINLVEFMYPLMQGYDSVPLKADVEIGGTDQLFNMMCARPIMKRLEMEPQDVMTVPLMVGLDGTEKMSKSLGNYIAINDSAQEMYGKTMSIPDHLIVNYFELATAVPMAEVREIAVQLEQGSVNPRDLKMRLAREIVTLYHGEAAVKDAEEQFVKVFQKGENPDEVELYKVGRPGAVSIIELLVGAGLVESTSEARRMVKQGAVKVDDVVVEMIEDKVDVSEERMVRVGKRRFRRVVG